MVVEDFRSRRRHFRLAAMRDRTRELRQASAGKWGKKSKNREKNDKNGENGDRKKEGGPQKWGGGARGGKKETKMAARRGWGSPKNGRN